MVCTVVTLEVTSMETEDSTKAEIINNKKVPPKVVTILSTEIKLTIIEEEAVVVDPTTKIMTDKVETSKKIFKM